MVITLLIINLIIGLWIAWRLEKTKPSVTATINSIPADIEPTMPANVNVNFLQEVINSGRMDDATRVKLEEIERRKAEGMGINYDRQP